MNKHGLNLLGRLVMLAVWLVACEPGALQDPQPTEIPIGVGTPEVPAVEVGREPATITIWHQWSGAQLQILEPKIQAYLQFSPTISVNLVPVLDIEQALAETVPGEEPDIVAGSMQDLSALVAAGRLAPLDGFGLDRAALAARTTESALDGATYLDRIWALPYAQSGLALVYNKALVPEAYLPTDPNDLNDLLEKVMAFKREFLSQYMLCNAGFGHADAYYLAPIYFGFGLPAYVDETGRAYLDTPEAQAAGQWLATISPAVSPEQGEELCMAAFTEGSVGMWWTGPEWLPAIEAAGIDYGVLPMGRPYIETYGLAITQQALDRGRADLALELIQHLAGPDAQRQLALSGAGIPVDPAVLAEPEIAALPAVSGYVAALSRGVPLRMGPATTAQWEAVGAASEAMWYRAQTPEEALVEAQMALASIAVEQP